MTEHQKDAVPGPAGQPDTGEPSVGPAERFWSWLAAGQLRYQRCHACDLAFHRPRLVCPHCGSADWTWFTSAGRGCVYSVTVIERPPPRHRAEAPYAVALVDLDEGFRALGRVVTGPGARIGDVVAFTQDTEDDGRARIGFRVVTA